MERIKYGTGKFMTPEERLAHKRALSKHYRDNHPEKIKAQNKYYSELYHKTKPFKRTCRKCGEIFNAARHDCLTCPKCVAKRHALANAKKLAKIQKRKSIQKEYAEILQMYKAGYTQEVIAATFGRAQSGISAILRRLLKK